MRSAPGRLLWTDFFSLTTRRCRYPFSILSVLDRDSRKRIFEEYLLAVTLEIAGMSGDAGSNDAAWTDGGAGEAGTTESAWTSGRGRLGPGATFWRRDPRLLAELGLPPEAGDEAIKTKFRELAKRHHPDLGGDEEAMRELLDRVAALLGRGR